MFYLYSSRLFFWIHRPKHILDSLDIRYFKKCDKIHQNMLMSYNITKTV